MSPARLLIFIFILAFLMAVIQIGALQIAFHKLGLSPNNAITLLFASLAGSFINLPLFRIRSTVTIKGMPPLWVPHWVREGYTLVALNVGGALIPFGFSLYLIGLHQLPFTDLLAGIATVSLFSYWLSRPIAGLGIGMPLFVAPVAAAMSAVMLNPEQSAPLAYVSGTMGVLIGADLLRLKDIRHLGVPQAAIGGAGTFDGIFLTGIVAVLLA